MASEESDPAQSSMHEKPDYTTDERSRILYDGKAVIDHLTTNFGITGVDKATKYYELALGRGPITSSHPPKHVAAACLYVVCLEMEIPFMLIEFSSELGVSVHKLGTVYLQLCKLLSLPFVKEPVDPSLFMHKYINELKTFRGKVEVLNTALHLAVCMKNDWIESGRKAKAICAAAIIFSCQLHQIFDLAVERTSVVNAVHACETTLTEIPLEFENAEALNFEKEKKFCKKNAYALVCVHKSEDQSGFELCNKCYSEIRNALDDFKMAQVHLCSGLIDHMLEHEKPDYTAQERSRILNDGKAVIDHLTTKLGITGVDKATKYYELALDHGLITSGHPPKHVAAVCLYVACREMELPFMFIEFSNELGVGIFTMTTVFRKLLNEISSNMTFFIIDPSLSIHKFVNELKMNDLGKGKVLNTALHIAVCMKRYADAVEVDGRGFGAAAVYFSSQLHGYNDVSKTDVVNAVLASEAASPTVVMFENTRSLNFESEKEFCKEYANRLVCSHKGSGAQSGFEPCRKCFEEFCAEFNDLQL